MANSIYEYYKRVSDRYYTVRFMDIRKIQHEWDPLAKRALIKGFEDFDLFIHKERSNLLLCEALTGMVVIYQGDLDSRIMRRAGEELFIDCLPAEINIR